jgi:hypothetical protein
LITYNVQVLHMAVVAWAIHEDALGGAAVIIWGPAVALTAVYWSVLRTVPRGAPPEAFTVATRPPEPSDRFAVHRR